MRKRVDLIRDDKLPDYHYDAGVIVSHQKKDELIYVLEQKDFKFCSDPYNNFTFHSPKSLNQMISKDYLLCNEWNLIFKNLQYNCIRSETPVVILKYFKIRHELVLLSPTLAQSKMEIYAKKIILDTNRKYRAKVAHQNV